MTVTMVMVEVTAAWFAVVAVTVEPAEVVAETLAVSDRAPVTVLAEVVVAVT
jgi:hypothetical protein